MSRTYEELAQYFAAAPIQLFGVHRTWLEGNRVYNGHVHQPTTKCAVIMALEGEATFIFDGVEHYRSIGYSDPYYFSRLFKKYKGVAPSQLDLDSTEA